MLVIVVKIIIHVLDIVTHNLMIVLDGVQDNKFFQKKREKKKMTEQIANQSNIIEGIETNFINRMNREDNREDIEVHRNIIGHVHSREDNVDESFEPDSENPSKKQKCEKAGPIKFVNPIPEHLICCICQDIFNKAVILHVCGHEFCENCILCSLHIRNSCPLCRTEVSGPPETKITPLRRLNEEIADLVVECPFFENGCCKKLKLHELEEHKHTCDFAIVECDNSCYGCSWKGKPICLKTHTQICEYEKVKKIVENFQLQVDALEIKNKILEGQVQKIKYTEALFRSRANRIKQSTRNKNKLPGCHTENEILVVRVIEKGAVRWVIRLRNSLQLGLLKQKMQAAQNGKIVILTCDAPLEYGGSEIMDNQTLYSLGLTHQPTIFAEFL
eukprot:c12603_g1_i2.p1 GENE.c12603_g1_i2~~c12603_g1_i2.p1  ORF type:complete len:388 (+),score=70.66 c12603_g1_i2:262-1425(+)